MRGKQSKENLANAKKSKLSVFSIVALLLCFVAALGIGGIAAAQSTTLTPFATDDVTVSIEQGVIKDGATGVLTKTDQTVRENDKVKYEITVHNSGAEESVKRLLLLTTFQKD